MLIGRRKMRDSLHNMQQLVDAAIEGIVVARNDRIVSVNQRLADLCSVPRAADRKSLAGDLIDTPIDTAAKPAAHDVGVPARSMSCAGASASAMTSTPSTTSPGGAPWRWSRSARTRRYESRRRSSQVARSAARYRAHAHVAGPLHVRQGPARGRCDERYATLYRLTPEDVKPGSTRRAIVERRVALGVWGGTSPGASLRDRTAVVDTSSYSIQEMNDGRSIAIAHVPMPGGGGCARTRTSPSGAGAGQDRASRAP